jgi:hypothetical protein
MKLNPSQELVCEHYCGGEFQFVKTIGQARKCGDGLFTFLMDEANDAYTVEEFCVMLDNAIAQLRSLRGEIG